jgi:predicted RNase H-like HicB family nuclease
VEVEMKYKVALHKSAEGYSVWVPELPGCVSQGATREDALANIADAVREYLDSDSKLSSETDWARVSVLADAEIDTSEIPPLNEAFFARASLHVPSSNPLPSIRFCIELAQSADLPVLPEIERRACELFEGIPATADLPLVLTPPEDFAAALLAGLLWVAREESGRPVGFALVSSWASTPTWRSSTSTLSTDAKESERRSSCRSKVGRERPGARAYPSAPFVTSPGTLRSTNAWGSRALTSASRAPSCESGSAERSGAG